MEGNPTPQDSTASTKSRDSLEGILERIVYFNEENNFTVARLQVKGQKDLVAIVGNMALPNPGETLRLRGQWITDAKFGQQFRVESCLTVLPSTLTGIERYLGSGLVKGRAVSGLNPAQILARA